MLTGSVVGVLYAVARVSAWVSLVGLAYAATLAAFTLPKFYELKQAEIDAALAKARSQGTAFYDKHLHKVGVRGGLSVANGGCGPAGMVRMPG